MQLDHHQVNSDMSIIKEMEKILDRVCAVEEYYRQQEDATKKKISELEQLAKLKKEEKCYAIMSNKATILQARRDLSSAEDDRRRARRHKEEAESSKTANIAGAVGFGLLTIFTFGIGAPITLPGITACTISAMKAREREGRAQSEINRCSKIISECKKELFQYERGISELDNRMDTLSMQISTLKSEQDKVHEKQAEIKDFIAHLHNTLSICKADFESRKHRKKRVPLLKRFLPTKSILKRQVPQQQQTCASAWENLKQKLEREYEHLFSINFNCHQCNDALHGLPYLKNGNFYCVRCSTLN